MSTRKKQGIEYHEESGFTDNSSRYRDGEEKMETFDYDYEMLKLRCKTIYEAAKAVHKFGEKVQEKREKEKTSKSKHIDKYKTKYTENLETLKEEIPFVDGLLNKKKRKIERSVSDAGKIRPQKCQKCDSKDREIREMHEKLGTHKDKEDSLKREVEMLKQQNDNLRQQCKAEKEAKDDALQRLSHLASSRLRDNNPNITDLSDQNRPTKIAEKLSELYDNEWTDAFDDLEKQDKDDVETIDILRKSMMNIYSECQRLANDNFFETVQGVIECPRQVFKPSPLKLVMSQQLMREIKEFRKCQATKVIDEIERIVLPRLDDSINKSKGIGKYLSKCIEIGWLMVVQDPPLDLVDEAPDKFDADKFKDYTKRGRFTEYVVWPALLLHKNGPILSKGVAQGSDHTFKSQSLGRSHKKGKGTHTSMVGTYAARSGNKRPAIKPSTFRSPGNDNTVTHV